MTDLAARFAAALDRAVAEHAVAHLVVALSGGRDSIVLLELAHGYAQARGLRLEAAHVDHGLHADSAAWAAFCRGRAAHLGVPCRVLAVEASPPAGASIEAWARSVRYERLNELLGRGSALLTAHHADDQAETVLQRALAGAGPYGLAAMRTARASGRGVLLRPLLGAARADLAAFAAARGLAWLDDPANGDPRFVRNRLRADVLPALEAVLPGVRAGLLRLAAIQGELAGLVDTWCDALLGATPAAPLALARVRDTTPELRPYLLRRWLLQGGAPAPGRQALRAVAQAALARHDAQPEVRVGERAVRRFAGHLHLTPWPLPTPPATLPPWQPGTPVELPWGRLVERNAAQDGRAVASAALSGAVAEWRFRTGGERLRLPGHRHHHRLKHLLQAWAVPPWQRGLLPLLFLDGRLAVVPGHAVAADFVAPAGDAGTVFDWCWRWEVAAAGGGAGA